MPIFAVFLSTADFGEETSALLRLLLDIGAVVVLLLVVACV